MAAHQQPACVNLVQAALAAVIAPPTPASLRGIASPCSQRLCALPAHSCSLPPQPIKRSDGGLGGGHARARAGGGVCVCGGGGACLHALGGVEVVEPDDECVDILPRTATAWKSNRAAWNETYSAHRLVVPVHVCLTLEHSLLRNVAPHATGPYSSESCNMTRSIMCRSTSCACVRVRASRACPRKGACARWRASRGRVRESSRARARGTGVRRTMACRGRQAMAQRGTQRTPHAWHTPDGIHRRVSTWHTVHTMRHEVGGEGKPARRARA